MALDVLERAIARLLVGVEHRCTMGPGHECTAFRIGITALAALGYILFASFVLASRAFAGDEPTTLAVPSATPEVVRTPVRVDHSHPPRIGAAYYPSESIQHHEEGRCTVRLTVLADGTTRDVVLVDSTGYPRLDKACVDSLFPGKLLPATENGKPVDKEIVIPIIWSLDIWSLNE